MITVIGYVYSWRIICVSLPWKLFSHCTCVLTIGNLICCLTLYSSVADILDRSNSHKLYLKVAGVSHNKKSREEDESDVPINNNKIEGRDKIIKGIFFNEDKSGVFQYFNLFRIMMWIGLEDNFLIMKKKKGWKNPIMKVEGHKWALCKK